MTSNSKTNTRTNTTQTSVTDTVFNGILSVIKQTNGRKWSGTMTQLNSALISTLGRRSSTTLPRSPSALRVVLNRVINRLRNRKISVKFVRTSDHTRTRLVKFAR